MKLTLKRGNILGHLKSKIFLAFILLVLSASLYLIFKAKDSHSAEKSGGNLSALDIQEQQLKRSDKLTDTRSALSLELHNKKYNDAAITAKHIAERTNMNSDWLNLIGICDSYNTVNKSSCIKDSVDAINHNKKELKFRDNLFLAQILDKNDFKDQASAFFKAAYKTYDETQADEYTPTKAQIKQKIDSYET